MKILALESTAKTAAVAVCDDDKCLYTTQSNNGMTHSQILLPMVQEALRCCALSLNDIDLFACTTGPGSFTGVRIATAVLKGLAFGKGKPCLSVSTLLSLASNLLPLSGIYCPVMDARREQVYTALFTASDGVLTRLSQDSALSLSQLAETLSAYSGKTVYLCGDGTALALRYLTEHGVSVLAAPSALLDQSAASTARCALSDYRNGKRGTDEELYPTYLRVPQAERSRTEAEENVKS